MNVQQIVTIVAEVIAGATLIFRGLAIIVGLTPTQKDDTLIKKVLKVLRDISGLFALNRKK